MQKSLIINGEKITFNLIKQDGDSVVLRLDDIEYSFNLKNIDLNTISIQDANKTAIIKGCRSHIVVDGADFFVESDRYKRSKNKGQGESSMQSPMPGKVLKYMVKAGEEVTKGSPLIVMEAMKMEHTIKASSDGKVEKLLYKEGELVQGGVDLVSFSPIED